MQRTFCSFNVEPSTQKSALFIPNEQGFIKSQTYPFVLELPNLSAFLPLTTQVVDGNHSYYCLLAEIPISTVSGKESLLGNKYVPIDLGENRTNISPSKRVENLSRDEILESLLGDNNVLAELPNRTNISPSKRPRRSKGQGSGYFLTRYSQSEKYGKKYPQTYYQVEFGKLKRSIFIAQTDVRRIMAINAAGEPIQKILEAINSPKAKEVAEEYRQYLLKKSRRKT